MATVKPEIVYIDARVRGIPATQRILAQLGDVPTELIADVQSMRAPRDFAQAKNHWLLTEQSIKQIFQTVQQGAAELRLGADFVTNTPYDCSFADLPIRLTRNPLLTVLVNIEEAMAELGRRCAAPTAKQIIVRCGHTSDALAIDHITKFSEVLVPFFGFTPNAKLELRTRTANVAHLFHLQHRGCTTVVFSVTPEALIAREERQTASLKARIVAARNLAERGYRIAFAIDPVIHYEGWERDYDALIDQLFAECPAQALAGMELSCFHYPRGLETKIGERFPESRIFYGELVPVNGCYRYFRPLRQKIYSHLLESIRRRNPQLPVRITQEHGLISHLY